MCMQICCVLYCLADFIKMYFFLLVCTSVNTENTSVVSHIFSNISSTSFPTYNSWRRFNEFQLNVGDLAVMKTLHVFHAVHLCPVPVCCAYQDIMPKALWKIQEKQRNKMVIILSSLLRRTEEMYSFWTKSKYQSKFGHPELTYLLLSLLAVGLTIPPLQLIHFGIENLVSFVRPWLCQ